MKGRPSSGVADVARVAVVVVVDPSYSSNNNNNNPLTASSANLNPIVFAFVVVYCANYTR